MVPTTRISTFFILTCVSSSASGFSLARGNKTVRFDRFLGSCTDQGNFPMHLENVRITRHQKIHYFSFKINIDRGLGRRLSLQLKSLRCKSKESLDTCEPTPDINLNGICELLKLKNHMLVAFLDHTEPPLNECPFEKGIYTCSNGTFNTDTIQMLALEGWYWRMHIFLHEVEDGKRKPNPIMCIYVESSVVSI